MGKINLNKVAKVKAKRPINKKRVALIAAGIAAVIAIAGVASYFSFLRDKKDKKVVEIETDDDDSDVTEQDGLACEEYSDDISDSCGLNELVNQYNAVKGTGSSEETGLLHRIERWIDNLD